MSHFSQWRRKGVSYNIPYKSSSRLLLLFVIFCQGYISFCFNELQGFFIMPRNIRLYVHLRGRRVFIPLFERLAVLLSISLSKLNTPYKYIFFLLLYYTLHNITMSTDTIKCWTFATQVERFIGIEACGRVFIIYGKQTTKIKPIKVEHKQMHSCYVGTLSIM